MEIRQAISMYLTAKAYNDPEFKVKFEKPNKNLDECVTYITYKVYTKVKEEAEKEKKQVGVAIPSDDEVFALAEQYYTDDDLKVDWNGTDFDSVRIVSAAATSFTDEEKQTMRQEAIKKYQDGVIAEMKRKDEERKAKTKAVKEKKPTNPVLVPDTKEENSEEPKENKQEAQQLSLF